MKHLVLSLLERVAARIPSALLMLLLAVYVAPATVGMYAWMIICLTFVQASIDVPLRQVSVEAVASDHGRRLLGRISRIGAAAGVLLLASAMAALILLDPRGLGGPAIQLTPLIAVPLITLSAVTPIAKLQVSGRWDVLASSQGVSAFGAMAVTIPILILTGSVGAAALQPLLAEGLNAVICRVQARKTSTIMGAGAHTEAATLLKEWWSVQAYSVLGWAQGQADRIFVGIFAGAAALGNFSYAAALGRTGSEAVTNAGVNVFRTHLQSRDAQDDLRSSLDRATLRVTLICAAAVGAVWIFADLILRNFLAPSWDPALDAAPILAASAVPAATTWHMSVALVAVRRTRQALPVRALGVVMGLAVALAAVHSLQLASFVIIARELIVMTLIAILLNRSAPVRSVILSWALCALITAASLLAAAASSGGTL